MDICSEVNVGAVNCDGVKGRLSLVVVEEHVTARIDEDEPPVSVRKWVAEIPAGWYVDRPVLTVGRYRPVRSGLTGKTGGDGRRGARNQ